MIYLRAAALHVYTVLDALTRPAPGITSREHRRQARLNSSIQLFAIPVFGLTCALLLLSGDLLQLRIVLGIAVFTFATYLFSRTEHYHLSSIASVLGTTLATFAYIAFEYTLIPLGGLLIVVMLYGQVYSWRETLIVAALTLITMALVGLWVDDLDLYDLITPLTMYIMAAVLAVTSAWNRERTQREIERRTRDLARSEARYRALFEQANDPILILNLEGKYVAANRRAARMLGYSVEELTGMAYYQVIAESERRAGDGVFEKLLQGETLPVYERTLVRRDGREIPAEVNTSLIRDLAGKPWLIQAIVRDITDRKAAERQRLELETERARLAALRQFIGHTSHDLRTPLSVINTSLYLLRKKLPQAGGLAHLDMVDEQVAHMGQVLEDLVQMSALIGSHAQFEFCRCDLNPVVGAVVRRHEALAARKNHTLTFVPAPGEMLAWADEPHLARAVQSLIVNALNYTPDGGKVTVQVCRREAGAAIEVQDSGIGIRQEDMPHIFSQFYRADAARPIHTGGAGLGLTIATKIVDAHGGCIEVQSEPGQGSRFCIVLPNPPE